MDDLKRINNSLKPCPFCGKPVSVVEIHTDRYGIYELRVQCCMDFDIFADEEAYSEVFKESFRVGLDPVEKWNRRVEK